MNKINAAYSYGGVDLLNQTLKENFKFEAPYYASITFQDFIDCVNELFPDGVEIDAEKSLDLDGVYIKKGKQVMDGNTLLQYARFREDEEGDFGRIRRQQQVIKAISQQLKDVTSIFKLPKAGENYLAVSKRIFLRVCYWIAVWISSKTIIKRSIHYPYQ